MASTLVSSLNNMFDVSLEQRYLIESGALTEILLMLLVGAMLATGAFEYQMELAGRRHLCWPFFC